MAGPGDALQSFECWKEGRDNQAIIPVGYSTQFFTVCRELGAAGLAISTHSRIGASSHAGITVEHRGDPFAGLRGIKYHAQHLFAAQRVLEDVRRFDANVLIVAQEPHPQLLSPLYRSRDVTVIQALHCPLWSQFGKVSVGQRCLLGLMSDFYRHPRTVVMTASGDVTAQVRQLSGPNGCAIAEFFPLYRPDAFAEIDPPRHEAKPFRIFFAGRIESAKGIFELLEIAGRLRDAGRTNICFDICGDGSRLADLKQRTRDANLDGFLKFHGWCEPALMRQFLSRSHVVIVPTNREYGEGFNQVVVEGLLAGRPVLTSEVCPAVEYVRPAVLLHDPDDVDAYCRSIIDLADNQQRYDELQSRALPTAMPFLDPDNSFAAAMRHLLVPLAAGQSPGSRHLPRSPTKAN